MKDEILDYSPPISPIGKSFIKKLRIFIAITIVSIVINLIDLLLKIFSITYDEITGKAIYYVLNAFFLVGLLSLAEILKKYKDNNTLILLIYLFCISFIVKDLVTEIYTELTILKSTFIGLPATIVRIIIIFQLFFVHRREIAVYFRFMGIAFLISFIIRFSLPFLNIIFRSEIAIDYIHYLSSFIVLVSTLILQLRVHSLLRAQIKEK